MEQQRENERGVFDRSSRPPTSNRSKNVFFSFLFESTNARRLLTYLSSVIMTMEPDPNNFAASDESWKAWLRSPSEPVRFLQLETSPRALSTRSLASSATAENRQHDPVQ